MALRQSVARVALTAAVLAATAGQARADVTLGDVTVSSDTSWSEDTYELDSLTVTGGATLTVAGGSTLNVSGAVTVHDGATILLQARDRAAQVGGDWQGVGVIINAAAVQVDTGGTMSADGQGYAGGAGPGVGGTDAAGHGGAGGGYGGVGGAAGDGVNAGGMPYGDAFAPIDLGSGGGATRTASGSGGGAILLVVTGTLTLEGIITADGAKADDGNCFSAPAGGGGAGGSLSITTATLAGAGSLTANGGNGGDGGCFPTVADNGGGGAGGRIAVRYAADGGFTGFTTSSVSGGEGGGHAGAPGTMVFLDTTANALRVSQHLDFPADTSPHFGALTVDNGATLVLGGGSTLTVDTDLVVAESSTVLVQGTDTGSQIDGQWQGAGATINARTLRVEAGSTVTADGQGYAAGAGPGAGGSDGGTHTAAGGGYGGIGGRAGDPFNPGGATYGDAFAPADLGSGGGAGQTAGAGGGGAITVAVSDTLILDGAITARGGDAMSGACSAAVGGGGSGGAIAITTATLTGAGLVSADGGAGGVGGCTGPGDDGGGGAGGRIAVRYATDGGFGGFTTSSVSGGRGGGGTAPPGTLAFLDTTTNALRVSQHLEFPPDTAATFGAVTIDDAATLTLGGGSTLAVDRDFVVTGDSTVLALGRNTDGEVGGDWNGTGVAIRARTARIDAGSSITADSQGYLGGLGPGVGGSDGHFDGGGGGYGGEGGGGGDGVNAGGSTYGDASAPLDLGSGGGVARSVAGMGGGAVWLGVRESLRLDGVISANGAAAGSVGCSAAGSGGGAGGSILVTAAMVAGDGALHADGGRGGEGGCTGAGDDGGGGGGGRIAVVYSIDGGFAAFTASTASGGVGGRPGAAGTVRFIGCGGDCNGDGRVMIDELIRMVNVDLGLTGITACLPGDTTYDGQIMVAELVLAVNHALTGCPATPPPTDEPLDVAAWAA